MIQLNVGKKELRIEEKREFILMKKRISKQISVLINLKNHLMRMSLVHNVVLENVMRKRKKNLRIMRKLILMILKQTITMTLKITKMTTKKNQSKRKNLKKRMALFLNSKDYSVLIKKKMKNFQMMNIQMKKMKTMMKLRTIKHIQNVRNENKEKNLE